MAVRNFKLSTGQTAHVVYEEFPKGHFVVALEIDTRKVVYEGDSLGDAQREYGHLVRHYNARQRDVVQEQADEAARTA